MELERLTLRETIYEKKSIQERLQMFENLLEDGKLWEFPYEVAEINIGTDAKIIERVDVKGYRLFVNAYLTFIADSREYAEKILEKLLK